MTLQDLTNYICEKLGKSDPVTQQICQDFLRIRHKMIYDAHLWRDTLALYNTNATTDEYVMPAQCARVVSVRWYQQELVPIDLNTIFQVYPTMFETTGTPTNFSMETNIGTAMMPPSGASDFSVSSTNAGDGGNVLIRGELAGVPMNETVTLNGTTPVNCANVYDIIFAFVPGVTLGTISLSCSVGGAASTLVSVPFDKEELKFVRIRLHENPVDTTRQLLVLYKRKIQDLETVLDTPMIQGIENALIAFAMGDMLERQRQYAQAQIKVTEGGAMMKVAKDLEIAQAGTIQRIIPYVGEPYGFIPDSFEPWWLKN